MTRPSSSLRAQATDDDVVGAGLEERDSCLDIVSRCDDQDRCDVTLRRSPRGGDRAGCREALGDDEIDGLSAHRGDGIGRRRDRCGAVPGVGQRRLELRSGSGPRAQIRIEVGGIGSRQRVVERGEYTASVAAVGSGRL